MDNGRPGFVVLLFADPHLLEGGQRGQDGATNPDGVFALRRGNDLDLHGAGCQGCDLLLHAVGNAGVHGGAPREDVVSIEVLPDVNVALHDAVVGGLMDASRLHPWKRDPGRGPQVVNTTQIDMEAWI